MDARQQREKLELELRRQRLPHVYIERLLAEWDDHLADLKDEREFDMNAARKPEQERAQERSTDILNIAQRLGDHAQLAAFAEQQYRRRSFLGRHPIFMFLLAPLPLILTGEVVVIAAMYLFATLFSYFFPNFDPHDLAVTYVLTGAIIFWLLLVVPPLATAVFLCRVARRNALSWRWAVAACMLIAIFCADLFVTDGVPVTENGRTQASMGIGMMLLPPITGVHWGSFLCHFLPQFALAMGIGMLLVKRAQRLQLIDESREEAVSARRAA